MRKHLILVVDDEPAILRLVRAKLQADGFAVVTATRGEEALRLLDDERPDLIVLDIMMARMNGYQVCSLIKRRHGYQHIPILLLTGKTSLDDKVNGWVAGCAGYITKPFEPQRLLEAVQRHLLVPDAMLIGGDSDDSADPGRRG